MAPHFREGPRRAPAPPSCSGLRCPRSCCRCWASPPPSRVSCPLAAPPPGPAHAPHPAPRAGGPAQPRPARASRRHLLARPAGPRVRAARRAARCGPAPDRLPRPRAREVRAAAAAGGAPAPGYPGGARRAEGRGHLGPKRDAGTLAAGGSPAAGGAGLLGGSWPSSAGGVVCPPGWRASCCNKVTVQVSPGWKWDVNGRFHSSRVI